MPRPLNLSDVTVAGPGGETERVSIFVDVNTLTATIRQGSTRLLEKAGVTEVSAPITANKVMVWTVSFDDGESWEVSRKVRGCASCGGRR